MRSPANQLAPLQKYTDTSVWNTRLEKTKWKDHFLGQTRLYSCFPIKSVYLWCFPMPLTTKSALRHLTVQQVGRRGQGRLPIGSRPNYPCDTCLSLSLSLFLPVLFSSFRLPFSVFLPTNDDYHGPRLATRNRRVVIVVISSLTVRPTHTGPFQVDLLSHKDLGHRWR